MDLRDRLRRLGLSNAAIDAVWPEWWSEQAEESPSARAELSFGVARRLGLDPASLLGDGQEPRFLWREEARFKHLTAEDAVERAGIESFGRAVANAIAPQLEPAERSVDGRSALEVRDAMLRTRPYVGLGDLLALCWGVGIPVVHLRVRPWPQKRMAAMTVRAAGRPYVLLAKDASYPAVIAFYLAHEIGHIALGHVEDGGAVVDMDVAGAAGDDGGDDEDAVAVPVADDEEEAAADEYALELLTGQTRPVVLPQREGVASARELARTASSASEQLGIEPGTLALLFGYSTGDWATANASMRRIYSRPAPVWQMVNAIAADQLRLSDARGDAVTFLRAVLGQGAGE